MSASNGRPLEATGRRSGAAAPARRTVRNHRFAVRSNWLKTRLPWNSLTGVAAPGVATVCAAAAAAGRARTAVVARAMAMRRMSGSTQRRDQSDVERLDVLRYLPRCRGADEDGGDMRVLQGERDRQCGRRHFQLRTEGDELSCGAEGGGVLRVVSLVLDAAV